MATDARPYILADTSLDRDAPVLVTGGGGMLGRALIAALRDAGFTRILAPSRRDLDLLDAAATATYVERNRPACVFHLASIVFGLLGNMRNQLRAISENTRLNDNVLTACAALPVRKIFFAGSVASYPYPYAGLPLEEPMLWQGVPHYGEYGYAHAKRHALAHLQILERELGVRHFYALLTNLYGPEDRFDEVTGHVIPSLIKKLHQARETGAPFRVWGDGSARRDFMYVGDAARAILAGMEAIEGAANISTGHAVSIREIVDGLCRAANFSGEIVWETDKPTGIPERSVSNAALTAIGFTPRHDLDAGLREAWRWFEANRASIRV